MIFALLFTANVGTSEWNHRDIVARVPVTMLLDRADAYFT